MRTIRVMSYDTIIKHRGIKNEGKIIKVIE